MSDAVTDPSAFADVLKALGSLSTTLQWMLFVAFILWVVVWRGLAWWDSHQANKRRIAEEAAAARKEKAEAEARAEQVEAANRLCTILEQHTADEDANATKMNHVVTRFSDSVDRLSQNIRAACEKMSGLMSRGDSITAIEDKMLGSVRADVCNVFDRSLRENDYANRSEFIKSKVKTAIGDILSAAQLRLQTSYHLSVGLGPFFTVRESDNGGNRFILCDELWYWVEPLYRKHTDIEPKIEEMRVIVGNVIADTLSKAKEAAIEAAKCELGLSI